MVEGQAGAGYEAVEGVWPVLKAFEPGAYEDFEPVQGDDGEVCQAAFDVRPHPLDFLARNDLLLLFLVSSALPHTDDYVAVRERHRPLPRASDLVVPADAPSSEWRLLLSGLLVEKRFVE